MGKDEEIGGPIRGTWRKAVRTVWDKAPLWAEPSAQHLKYFCGPIFYADSESDFIWKHLEKPEQTQGATHALACAGCAVHHSAVCHHNPLLRFPEATQPAHAKACVAP